MKKATHFGTCQVCGSGQKLPIPQYSSTKAGLLAKHGYTVEWNMFQGVCYGSDHLPFEQSKDLIEDAIQRAEKEAWEVQYEAEELEDNFQPEEVWVQLYHAATWENRQSRNEWRKVSKRDLTVVAHEVDGHRWLKATYSYKDGNRERGTEIGTYEHGDLFSKMHAENLKRAGERRNRAEKLRQYAKWQRERIANWAPKALTPVEPKKASFGRCHGRDGYAVKCGQRAIDASGRCENHPQGWDQR